jgi:protein tyrosine phosphatase (PTP) superfamily phosphohydrolase (DUF442 family)
MWCRRTVRSSGRRKPSRVLLAQNSRRLALPLNSDVRCHSMRNATSIPSLEQRFRDLGRKIKEGDESQLHIWVIPGLLAGCHRPLRHNRLYGGSARTLDAQAAPLAIAWADHMKKQGFKSIICLMSEEEVAFYENLELAATDLLDFYRNQGFVVTSIPWKDPAHVRSNPGALKAKEAEVCRQAIAAYDRLPKPVLLHCSAGVDRSSPVLAHIAESRGGARDG